METVDIKISKRVPYQERFSTYVKLYCQFMNLNITDRELSILDLLHKKCEGKISATSRKFVSDKLNITEFNLNNYLRKMRIKKLVTENEIVPNIKNAGMINDSEESKSNNFIFTCL